MDIVPPLEIVMRFALFAMVMLICISRTLADEPIVSFDSKFELSGIKLVGGASASVVKAGTGHVLRVETGTTGPRPGFEIPAPGGRWDLSKYFFVELDVKNVGSSGTKVECRIDNPKSPEGKPVTLGGGVNLAPGQSGTIRLELHGKPDWVKVDLFGMRGYPWSASPGSIDPANIVNLVVFISTPPDGGVFEVSAIRAAGEYVPPIDLLKDPDKFFPFIDEFGQYIHADWPGKIHSIDELAQARQQEQKDLSVHPPPADWDKYGGWKDGPTLKATGWFYTVKHEGKWWLVDPEGKLFFSNGINCVTPREGMTPVDEREKWFRNLPGRDTEFKDCYSTSTSLHGHYQGKKPTCFYFGQANLMRKYGPQWRAAFGDMAHARLRSWTFNTMANWSDAEVCLQDKTPYVMNAGSGSSRMLEGSSGFWSKFKDVFDEDFKTQLRKSFSERLAKTAKDPWCIGYFVDNELEWGDDVFLAMSTLASPADQAAKKVFVSDLRAKYADIAELNKSWGTAYSSWDDLLNSTEPPDKKKAHDDLAAFTTKTAETYFKTVREALRECAPHQLYLGCRFGNINAPAVAVLAAAKYCDVVSYNIYSRSAAEFRLPAGTDVPLIIGEYTFAALDRGMFHPSPSRAASQEDRAKAFKAYLSGVLRHPQFVGCHWFAYADQATTGRPLDEENFQIGFVSITDTPYPETVNAAREVGSKMYDIRAKGSVK